MDSVYFPAMMPRRVVMSSDGQKLVLVRLNFPLAKHLLELAKASLACCISSVDCDEEACDERINWYRGAAKQIVTLITKDQEVLKLLKNHILLYKAL